MKNTNDKIVELVKKALDDRDDVALYKLSDILGKRADFEWRLNEFLRDIKTKIKPHQ